MFDNYTNADKVLEDFLFTTRRRSDLSEQAKEDIQWFCLHNLKKRKEHQIKKFK